MKVRVKTIMEGPGPSEAVVAVKTSSNREEEIVVQKNQIEDNTLRVWPVGERENSVLVELPQESASGNWRLWVDRQEVA
ncbi:MAG: hypothetical protein ACREHV_01255 [Rhizomicrobium sp.]